MTWPRAIVVMAVTLAVFSLAWAPAVDRALNPTVADEAADFPNYYFGGERWRADEPVYDPLDDEIEVLFGLSGYDTYPADPPPTVVLFSPISAFEYDSAWRIWQAVSAALVLAAVALTARTVGYSAPLAAVLATAAFLTTPVRFLLERNHMESMLLLLGVVGWIAARRGRTGRAAMLWGVATGLKLFPGMWLVGLFDRVRRGDMIRGLGIAVAILVVGAGLLGLDNVEQFVRETVPGSRRWYGVLGNYSLLSVGTAWAGAWLGWLLVAIALITLLPRYVGRPSGPDRTFVMGTALALLLSPLTWLNYLVLAIPALVILSTHLDLRDSASHRIGFVAMIIGLVGWGPIVTGSEVVSELLSFVPTYTLVALFIVADRVIKEDEWRSTSAILHRQTG